MKKVYIKGNSKRYEEVIDALIKQGGVNKNNRKGDNDNAYYFIDINGVIDFVSGPVIMTLMAWIGEEIKLPEPKSEPKFKVGDKVKTIHGIQEITKVFTSDIRPNIIIYAVSNFGIVEEQFIQLANTLKKFDPVMVSDNGETWRSFLYYGGISCCDELFGTTKNRCNWKYIVPLSDFDFNDLESNIKKSVV